VRRDTQSLILAVIASCLLAGCGWFHRNKQDDAYKTSVQERPLEVPPDLDKPSTAGALVIPNVGGAAAAAPAADAAGVPPMAAAPTAPAPAAPAAAGSTAPPAAVAAAPGATLSGDSLHVADTVDSTYARVALALERSGAATVLARDDAGHSYDVQTVPQTVSKPGWFKKTITLGMAKGESTPAARLKVVVTPDGTGSRVSVEGATDKATQAAAHALLATLTARLS
jgi:uncharacterized lipoprotein